MTVAKTMADTSQNIDSYVAAFPADVQKVLEKIRKAISICDRRFTEAISYGIPTFRIDGKNVIHFAGFKNHVGVYPAPRGAEEFADELSRYKGGKGTVQFPLDKDIPYDLIERIARYRIAEFDRSRSQ